MSTLSLYRTFGDPAFRPATARVKLYDARWYVVTMQNTSSDQGDGHYLEPGEYTELLPGHLARRARDAHLNHCNAIREYTGEVWQLTDAWYGGRVSYHTSQNHAASAIVSSETDQAFRNREAIARHDRALAKTDEQITEYHKLHWDFVSAANERAQIRAEQAEIVAYIATHTYTRVISRIR